MVTAEPAQLTQGVVLTEAMSEGPEVESAPAVSRAQAVALISCITCIACLGTLLAGLLTVCIPVIAAEMRMPADLQLWPQSAFALACGCALLPCGAAADVLGCRRACLLGALLQSAFAMGAGLSANPTQLIALRAAAGIAAAFCLPSTVGVAAHAFPATISPRRRSFAFAAMGGGQAVGFGLGLVVGGVCADTIGWRWGFHFTAILNTAVLALSLWALPVDVDGGSLGRAAFARLAHDVDWCGAMLVSAALALLSYVLAVATGPDADRSVREPLNLTFLCVGIALLPASVLWMHRQTRLGRPALIPNALWTNVPFTAVCVIVFLIWGALNASEQLASLYMQDVLHESALTSSLYFLPAPIGGMLMNIAIGVLLPYLRPSLAVPAGCLVSGVAPLLLATLCRVDGPGYWGAMFQAMALNPLSADLVYTIANLVVTAAFPNKTQALAGSVFNMVAQIGKSVGIATTGVIARRVTVVVDGVSADEALLRGYKAGWWYNCAMGFASVGVSYWGLKSVGKLGVKRE